MPSVRILVPAAVWLVAAVTAQYGAMEIPAGLSPRYYLGGAQLLERQISGVGGCSANQHPCEYSLRDDYLSVILLIYIRLGRRSFGLL
jgi:hypothetical protein